MIEPSGQAELAVWNGRTIVWVTDPDVLPLAVAAVQRTIDAFDLACSSFRDDSELAVLNAAGGAPVAAGPVLLDAVQAALRAAQETDGDLDPTVGDALIAYGFNPPPAGGRPRLRFERVPGWRTVTVDEPAATIQVARGVRLDLGATAKALAADRAVAAVHAAVAPAGVLVSLSGDLATAGPAPLGGWRIHVTDDHRSDAGAAGQTVMLHSGALATSSTTVRVRTAGERPTHHLIDPATGAPAAVYYRTVSVTAPTCLEANVASTTAIIRGPRARDWLEQRGLPARLVRADGLVEHVGGWPSAGESVPAAEGVGGHP
jgi:thiamine biosynthesis lipoprotein